MDLVTMRERAKNRFRDPTNIFVLDPTWDESLNAAYFEFWQAARWPQRMTSTTKTLVANQQSIDLTVDELSFLTDVYDSTQDRPLDPVPGVGNEPSELARRLKLFLQNQPSEPIFYALVGQKLHIFPAPRDGNHTITIWYHQTDPAKLEVDTDTPVFPERYHEAIVAGAVAKAYLDDGNVDQALGYRKEFTDILNQAFRELKPKGIMPEYYDEQYAKLAALASIGGSNRGS